VELRSVADSFVAGGCSEVDGRAEESERREDPTRTAAMGPADASRRRDGEGGEAADEAGELDLAETVPGSVRRRRRQPLGCKTVDFGVSLMFNESVSSSRSESSTTTTSRRRRSCWRRTTSASRK
jgi:hypothetical protein